jgi:hypothetical protein
VLKIIKSKLSLNLLLILSITFGQEYNPCKDKRFLSLRNIELDEMSDREYNYFIKKEEECSKYKTKMKRPKKKRSKKANQNNRKTRKRKTSKKRTPKIKTYLPGVYFSAPAMRLQMTSDYDKTSISGFKLETPISIDIGKLNPYLVFEFRSYNFSFSDNEENELLDGKFGGNAILGGLKLPFNLLKTRNGWFRPELSVMTGKFHFTKGLLLGLDIPQKLSENSSIKIKYSARLNIIQTDDNNGTGWLDVGIFFGYELSEKLISKITDYF